MDARIESYGTAQFLHEYVQARPADHNNYGHIGSYDRKILPPLHQGHAGRTRAAYEGAMDEVLQIKWLYLQYRIN